MGFDILTDANVALRVALLDGMHEVRTIPNRARGSRSYFRATRRRSSRSPTTLAPSSGRSACRTLISRSDRYGGSNHGTSLQVLRQVRRVRANPNNARYRVGTGRSMDLLLGVRPSSVGVHGGPGEAE